MLTAATLTVCIQASSVAQAISIVVDQMGYHPGARKTVLLLDVPADQKIRAGLIDPTKVDVFNGSKGKRIFKIEHIHKLKETRRQVPGTVSYELDFTEFKAPGTFKLELDGLDYLPQADVTLTEFLYWDTLKPVVRLLYLMRSGQELYDPVTKVFRLPSHLHDGLATNSSGETELHDAIGGWYDNGAGFIKSIGQASLTTARLMSLFEWAPRPFQQFYMEYPPNEPAVGAIPDLLHEAQIGVDWILAMQQDDGHFYGSVHGDTAKEPLRPEDDEQPRYLTAATPQEHYTAVATLAMASRVYREKDLGLSVKTLMQAEKSWRAMADAKIDTSDLQASLPHKLWAACELYLSTNKPVYWQAVQTLYPQVGITLFSEQNPALMGLANLALYAPKPQSRDDKKFLRDLKSVLVDGARPIVKRIEESPYQLATPTQDGRAHQILSEQLAVLLVAHRLSGDQKFRDAASAYVRYVSGLNVRDQQYVTGLVADGDDDVDKHPAPTHWLSKSYKKSIPGLFLEADGRSSAFRQASLAFVLGALNAQYNLLANPGQ